MNLTELVREASKLPEKERASLALHLLNGLERPVHDVPDDEVLRRVKEGDEDPSVMVTFDELAGRFGR